MSDNENRTGRKPRFFENWLGLAGSVIAIGSGFAFVLLFAIDLISHHGNPYMGILAYVVAPGFTVLGGLLIALGLFLRRKQIRGGGTSVPPSILVINLSRSRDRKLLALFVAGSIVFLLATALGSYNTYHLTESVAFCGQTCHVPMKPEFMAYQHSPHAKIDCVECHVGSGADYYVKAKLNGVHQLIGVITGKYSRPIKTPVRNMCPAQDTCQTCHWQERFVGNLDKIYNHFLADETNTQFNVRLSLKVGGGDGNHGAAGGIHWHMSSANKVEYMASDEQRQVIPWVRVTDRSGKVTEYKKTDFKGDLAGLKTRTMDCMDCHNRPAHQFHSPNDEVDQAMATGRIDPGMTWVKSNVVAVLTASYSTEPEALEKISAALNKTYGKHPKKGDLVAEVQKIYQRNFFPEMKADWRAYPVNTGHKEWAGCFRCHDGLHKASDGKKMISATDCNACHTILAQGTGEEFQKMNPKGLSFFHVDAEYSDFSCNNCHTGSFPK